MKNKIKKKFPSRYANLCKFILMSKTIKVCYICRWDYSQRTPDLEAFKYLRENGVVAEYMKPVFPSQTSPNHFSIATGKIAFTTRANDFRKLII